MKISGLAGDKIGQIWAKLKERRNYRHHHVNDRNIVDKI